MGETPSKLFHAIVGLGLAAAGCGDVLAGSDDASAGEGRGDVSHGQTGDAVVRARPDATFIMDATADARVIHVVDAMIPGDTGADVEEADVDAARAHDAALDVSRPPPPPIK